MSDVTLAKLENHKEGLVHAIRLRDAAIRLERNPDYKLLITQGFCLEEAARYAQSSGDPALSAENRADAMAMAQASGHLKRFMHVTKLIGDKSEADLPELDTTIVQYSNNEE